MINNGVASEYDMPDKKVEIWDMAYKSPKTVRDTLWDIYQQGRADAIEEYKYNVELFREIFLEELERQAIDREEIIMYRNICSIAWNKYLEQLQEKK